MGFERGTTSGRSWGFIFGASGASLWFCFGDALSGNDFCGLFGDLAYGTFDGPGKFPLIEGVFL